MIKLDLHTHTNASPDSVTSKQDLKDFFEQNPDAQIAITDHDKIRTAIKIQKEFGPEKIIVGQEVTIEKGNHIIALFINKFIPTGLPARRTAQLIRNQNGLVYIPHPFDKKNGVGEEITRELNEMGMIDIIEVHNSWSKFVFPIKMNGRKKENQQASELADELELAKTAASDSHGINNTLKAHAIIKVPATRNNLIDQLKHAELVKEYNSVGINQVRGGLKVIKSKLPLINRH